MFIINHFVHFTHTQVLNHHYLTKFSLFWQEQLSTSNFEQSQRRARRGSAKNSFGKFQIIKYTWINVIVSGYHTPLCGGTQNWNNQTWGTQIESPGSFQCPHPFLPSTSLQSHKPPTAIPFPPLLFSPEPAKNLLGQQQSGTKVTFFKSRGLKWVFKQHPPHKCCLLRCLLPLGN